MKRIVYTRPDGGLSIVLPSVGARLAYGVTLPNQTPMRNTVMTAPAEDRIVRPASEMVDEKGAPLEPEIREKKGAVYEDQPIPVDRFLRRWPVEGAKVDWAETEDEFVARIAKTDVSVVLTDTPDVVRAKMGVELLAEDSPPTVLNRGHAQALGIGFKETQYAIIEASALPADRHFRNAWTHDNGTIVHDLAKCRAIQKDKLRAERAPLLAAQDVLFQRAIAAGDAAGQARVESEKQRLRDVTKLADKAESVDELRALTVASA